jgi:hypothetical protein
MKQRLMSALALMGLIVAANADAAQRTERADCDRSCLTAKLDQFLKAVVDKNPAKAGLFVGFRQTQNAVLTPAGEGIWKTNTGFGTLDRRFYDPVTSQAEFYGTIREGDKLAIASLRMRVERNEITEAEWHIARATDPGITGDATGRMFDVDSLLNNQPAQRVVPVANRTSREALIAAVNSYFDGITLGTGRNVQANPGCLRLENGTGVTGPGRRVAPADADFQTSVDCRSGYAGLNIVNVAARRYLLVDEEAQVVVASAVFIREPRSPKRRNCFMEVFFMDGGKISQVYAAMVYADPKLPMPNWAPYDGNFPIAEPLVAPH